MRVRLRLDDVAMDELDAEEEEEVEEEVEEEEEEEEEEEAMADCTFEEATGTVKETTSALVVLLRAEPRPTLPSAPPPSCVVCWIAVRLL
jgi:hypothetical protein